jgi:BirA family biotin operon repressor/biotin-[acetyl-CoA-carboxylase] ligase
MPWLMMVASVAAAEAVELTTRLQIGIKWPNDLMVERSGVWHKVSGLLVEGDVAGEASLTSLVLGIGINVNIPAEMFPSTPTPATSLMASVGRPVSRLVLLLELLDCLERHYEAAESGRSPLADWKNRLITLGQAVQVADAGAKHVITGRAVDTDRWGRLLVRDSAGQLHTLSAGDVSLSPI